MSDLEIHPVTTDRRADLLVLFGEKGANQPAWVISCFYIDKQHRNTGVATALLAATVDHARSRGADLLEGFPWDKPMIDDSWGTMFVGSRKMFANAGFDLVEHRGKRAVMRRPV